MGTDDVTRVEQPGRESGAVAEVDARELEGRGRVGMSVGPYRILADLGSGGMGDVYLAVADGKAGVRKLVVLKLLRPHLTGDVRTLRMFHDEARVAARLNHPNVVQTIGMEEDGEHHAIVMEYLDGQPLNHVVDRGRTRGAPLPLSVLLQILDDVLSGLEHAHRLADFDGTPLGLVHRDVSPHNVFVTYDGQVKVLDFGIAKVVGSTGKTTSGVIKGKFRYLAPEVFEGARADQRADVYAVGVMLWEAATGEKLWRDLPEREIIGRVLRGGAPSPKTVRPSVPDELERICMRALAPHDARYESCVALQADLDRFRATLGERLVGRELGKLVATMFEDVRAERKRIIDEQLARVASLPLRTSEDEEAPDTERPPRLPGSGYHHSLSTRVAGRGGDETVSEDRREKAPAPPIDPPKHRSYGVFVGSALAAIAIGAVLFARPATPVRDTSEAPSAPHADADPAPRPIASEAHVDERPAPAPSVTVAIRTTPADAAVFVDDERLAENPTTRPYPRDASTHVVRVERAGYATRTLAIVLDRDQDVVVALDKATPAPPETARPTRATPEPHAASPKTAADTPTAPAPPPAKPARPLDTSSPY